MVTFGLDEGRSEMTTPTLLFIHGFLDDATVWDGVVGSLGGDIAAVRYDLPGFGTRIGSVADPGTISLESLAAEAGDILAGVENPVFVVGQSLGAQVAELVAAEHADQVHGLVLLTPVPLGGTQLSDEAVAPFRRLGADVDAQRAARAQLSPSLTEQQLDRLTRFGGSVGADVSARYVDVWNQGVKNAPASSAFTGPILVIRGGADAFVTEQLLESISRRFVQPDVRAIEKGGHWLHVEYPEAVAAMILEFTGDIMDRASGAGWRRGFADKSQTTFADGFADEIVLEASVLAKPIAGKTLVSAALSAASAIYDSLEFTEEAHNASTSYLQWRASAFDGVEIKGVTVLQRNADGKVVTAAIHHRPLSAALRFSAELSDRLAGVIPAEHFLSERAQ
jgi:pimeloyl-ACP methyl ester carboxylesterase